MAHAVEILRAVQTYTGPKQAAGQEQRAEMQD